MHVKSILDNDQYKFTMQQAIMKLGFAAVPVEYNFKCRNEDIFFTPEMADEIFNEIMELQTLKLSNSELNYMKGIRYFSKEYIEFIKYFRFDPELVFFTYVPETGEIKIRVIGGWFRSILYEVPILTIVSSVYMKHKHANAMKADKLLDEKLDLISQYPDFRYMEFGTRRRMDYDFHNRLVFRCKKETPDQFLGTSNMHFAMIHDVKCFGTMAHEWLQAHQQLKYRVADSQRMAFENWIEVYRGDLGIALSDVINTDAFLKDFDDPFLYKLFDGVREDSEPDPINFGHRMVNFYFSKGIDPLSKTIVFSNSLSFEKAIRIHNEFKNLIGNTYGIGTYLTNDCGIKPLNIVMKMVKCNGQHVAKISNSPGKGMCESEEYVNYLKSVYNVKE